MTIIEAIKHYEEVMQEKRHEYQDCIEARKSLCRMCSKECTDCKMVKAVIEDTEY